MAKVRARIFVRGLLALSLGFSHNSSGATQEQLLSPAAVVLLAHSDIRHLPEAEAVTTRYLWLPNLPALEANTFQRVLAGHVNQLSRASDLVPLRRLGKQIVAVNLNDYHWSASVWDDFAKKDHTFYATVTTESKVVNKYAVLEYWPGGYENGRYYEAGTYKVWKEQVVNAQKSLRRTFAPWLTPSLAHKQALEELAQLSHSRAPLVNALVFFDNTAASGDGRKPDYYDFLGIKDEASFQKLIGAEVSKDVAFATDLLAAVGVSGVTQEPRAIQRIEKRGGAYWRSFDVNRGTAQDNKNALRALGSNQTGEPTLHYDASEQYGHLANGLWAFGLFNAAGVKQDRAPDTIAQDTQAVLRNRHSVIVCVSCIRCHSNGGLQDLDDWLRNFPPELNVLSGDRLGKKKADATVVRQLRQQYGRRLAPFLERDRQRYATALLEITGLKPEAYAQGFARCWAYASDNSVNLDYASRELGVPVSRIRAALQQQALLGKLDPVLASWLLPVDRQKPLLVTQWREAYPVMQQYLAELPP